MPGFSALVSGKHAQEGHGESAMHLLLDGFASRRVRGGGTPQQGNGHQGSDGSRAGHFHAQPQGAMGNMGR